MGGRDATGKFVRGHSGFKPHGAQSELRQNIKTFLAGEWPNFQTWFSSLKDREKVETYLALLPFVIGKINSIELADHSQNQQEDLDLSVLSDQDLRDIARVQGKLGLFNQ
ncbi:MAG: hypothetical protein ACK5DD_08245 [Cyclobacteriaceae bacterium]|jgi:hypothetical protein